MTLLIVTTVSVLGLGASFVEARLIELFSERRLNLEPTCFACYLDLYTKYQLTLLPLRTEFETLPLPNQ